MNNLKALIVFDQISIGRKWLLGGVSKLQNGKLLGQKQKPIGNLNYLHRLFIMGSVLAVNHSKKSQNCEFPHSFHCVPTFLNYHEPLRS